MNNQRIVGAIAMPTALMVGVGSNLAAMIEPPSVVIVIAGMIAAPCFRELTYPSCQVVLLE